MKRSAAKQETSPNRPPSPPKASEVSGNPTLLPRPFRRSKKFSYGTSGLGNSIIHGENLAALRALQKTHSEEVRTIYLDPPYNNKERYRHYDDSEGHDRWIADLEERLDAMRPLLTPDGSLWISIDDNEMHYLKVAADRVLGRKNFLTTIVWQMRTTRENRRAFSNDHEYILVYAACPKKFRRSRNLLPPSQELLARYKNPDDDPRGLWQSVSVNAQDGHATAAQFYELIAPNGRKHQPPEGRCWLYTRERMQAEIDAGNIWFGKSGDGVPRKKRFLAGAKVGLTPETLWHSTAAGTNDHAKKQLLQLFPDQPVFDTPKPEALIARILKIASDPGDLVLDAYLGSGTTAAVAHKLRRRYLGIEAGDQAKDLAAKRLMRVVDGDGTGISKDVSWNGGGGFDYFRLR